MTYVRKFGRPDLFITFTCNPEWPEMKNELLPGQKSYNRHNLVSRVFHLKLKKMIDLLTKKHIFRPTQAFVYSIEWQKRGLPHAHILLWLANKVQPDSIDDIILAEIPDKQQDPILHNIVIKNIIHGPCRFYNPVSPCMKENICSKNTLDILFLKHKLVMTVTQPIGTDLQVMVETEQLFMPAEYKLAWIICGLFLIIQYFHECSMNTSK